MDDKELMTPGEAAKVLGVKAATLGRWAERGVIRAYTLPMHNIKRYYRAEIEALKIKCETKEEKQNEQKESE